MFMFGGDIRIGVHKRPGLAMSERRRRDETHKIGTVQSYVKNLI
jgi:hypothetical protein